MTTRGDAWRTRAVTAYDKFQAIDGGNEIVYCYASMAEASGRLNGWTHPDTTMYFNKVYSLQKPDGGYGLNTSWDVFGDGSVNDANTTYTVTLADHVGMPLLAGFKAGVVPRDKVQSVVNLVMKMPRIAVSPGQCIAYSNRTNDVKTGYEVHNVNAGAAYFLSQAAALGFSASTSGLHRTMGDITVYTEHMYRTADIGWAYRSTQTTLQDPDHQSYTAQSMYNLAYWTGREVTYKLMTTSYPGDATAPLAHMRLVSTPGGPASWGSAGQPYTLWAELGDQWLTEADAFIANPPATDTPQRLAQAAVFCSRNSEVL